MSRFFSTFFLFTSLLAAGAEAEPILVCGAGTVFEIDTTTALDGKIEKTWVWNPKHREELPQALRRTFGSTDDCKPVEGGKKILVSSSFGGCAVVERPSGKVLWYAQVTNAHSIELLPRDRIVVASAVDVTSDGLVLFDLARSNQPIWGTRLLSAHGVVWDAQRRVLWALGCVELRCFDLKDWESLKPSLALKAAYPTPQAAAHDLQAVPHSNDLVLTTGTHIYLFDREKRAFRLHPDLGDRDNTKSISIHPVTGQVALVLADHEWWSHKLWLASPPGKIDLPKDHLYKARWLPVEAEKK
jgi:hypothetical protein